MEKRTNKRKGIPKSIRFEVFKRDKFKCQYCGSSAPEVLLHIDHINPVSNGGTNEIINLVTACFSCNSGKSNKLLSDDTIVSKQKEQLDQLQERREQLEMMFKWHEGLKNLKDEIQNKLREYWENLAVEYEINENGMLYQKKLTNEFTFDEILKAMDSSAEQYFVFENGIVPDESWGIAFNKIRSILKVNRESIDKPDLKEFFYIRAIIRNRLNYYDPRLTMEWLEAAKSWGATIDELKRIARTTYNWNSFSTDIDEIIEKYKKIQEERRDNNDIFF